MGRSAPASSPTLRKLGADLRWLLEKSGVNPEKAIVTVGVVDDAAKQALLLTIAHEFDKAVMGHVAGDIISLHGVMFHVVVNRTLANIGPPQEPA